MDDCLQCSAAQEDTVAHDLPQLDADLFLTDGGLETTLIFLDGLDLPDFAAFPLLDDEAGRQALVRYFDTYAEIAGRDRVGIVLETPTWRASADWGGRQGYGLEEIERVNRDAVALLEDVRRRHDTPDSPIVISGCIGPRGDGYHPDALMTPDESRRYHALQARAFADAGADLITAITMTHSAEAIGIVDAARAVGLPVVISFTVETNGELPSGEALGVAIETVDAATDACAAYYMVNCAHPTHFASVFDPLQPWMGRIRGIRANASRMSHDELDEAEELDRGDPAELAALYRELRETHPQLTVLGGCCGTDHHHIAAISEACAAG
jgi:S-methylmethionine-dependent homocysteine/selenocysteine methylase